MDMDSVIDLANQAANEIARFRVDFTLSPDLMMTEKYVIPKLAWDSVSYGDEEIDKVPDDRRGIYAFVVCHDNDVLPRNGYVLYIGIAGEDSQRPLRKRYKDYLNARIVMKRARIMRMIGTWHNVLRFFFAPVDDDISSEDLKTLELQLNTALLPPFSERDLDAAIKEKRKAFRT